MKKRKEKEDLRLLAKAFFDNISYDGSCEFGSIGLDCKRPFGNSSVTFDILEIIGAKFEEHEKEGDSYSDDQHDYARNLYCEKLVPYLKKTFSPNAINKTLNLVKKECEYTITNAVSDDDYYDGMVTVSKRILHILSKQ